METRSTFRNDSLFPLLELRAPLQSQARNLILDMVDNRLPGVIIRGLYDQEAMATVGERIATGEAKEALFSAPNATEKGALEKHIHYYGINLVTPNTALTVYQDFAGRFDNACRKLFRDLPDFRTTLLQNAEQLGPGMRATVPSFVDGAPYTFATIRVFPPGLEVPLHCGNRMLQHVHQYEHLRSIAAADADQLSYFMQISTPDSGGELLLYDLYWDESHAALSTQIQANKEMVENCQWQRIALAPGDMVIFNGGRIYHQISRVEGTRVRRTIGGFVSVSKDRTSMFFYS